MLQNPLNFGYLHPVYKPDCLPHFFSLAPVLHATATLDMPGCHEIQTHQRDTPAIALSAPEGRSDAAELDGFFCLFQHGQHPEPFAYVGRGASAPAAYCMALFPNTSTTVPQSHLQHTKPQVGQVNQSAHDFAVK